MNGDQQKAKHPSSTVAPQNCSQTRRKLQEAACSAVIKVHFILWYIAMVTQRCWTCFVVWVNKAAVLTTIRDTPPLHVSRVEQKHLKLIFTAGVGTPGLNGRRPAGFRYDPGSTRLTEYKTASSEFLEELILKNTKVSLRTKHLQFR